MSPGGSSIWRWPWRAIRRCCSISTTPSPSAPTDGGPAARQGLERESRPRASGAAHPGRRWRLHAEGRGSAGAHPDWLVGGAARRSRTPAAFMFRARIHEPGTKILLGRSFAEDGESEARTAIKFLADHPATATHIATKLARHFIADDPPKDSIERIARVFRDTGGDLRQVTAAVVKEDAAWRAPFAKLRTPDRDGDRGRVASPASRRRRRCWSSSLKTARPDAVLRAVARGLARRRSQLDLARGGAAPRAMVRDLRRPHARSARSCRARRCRLRRRAARRDAAGDPPRARRAAPASRSLLASPQFQRR